MGATYIPETFKDAKDFYLNSFVKDYNSNVKVLDFSVKGNVIYDLVELINADGEKVITINVIKYSKNKNENETSYSYYNEMVGPCYYDCPKKFLKKSTKNDVISTEWRKKCDEYSYFYKVIKNKIKSGDLIKEHHRDENIKFKYALNKNYYVGEIEEGIFKFNYKNIYGIHFTDDHYIVPEDFSLLKRVVLS